MADYQLYPKAAKNFKQRTALRLLACFGWHVIAPPFPGPRGVIIIYPHTSNWDFFIAILAKWSVGAPFRWLGKEQIFQGVFGAIFGSLLRSWGGEPVERHAASGSIERIAQRFGQHDWYWLGLSPEGTRRYSPRWRSGFYYIALAAKVPLALGYIDYGKKQIGIAGFINLTGDKTQDQAVIRALYAGKQARHPHLAALIEWP